jgi:amino acid transporter
MPFDTRTEATDAGNTNKTMERILDRGLPVETVADGGVAGTLASGVLGTADILFMVIAVAAPMAIVVATMPLAFALGNGAGATGVYLLAGLAMALFAVGYVRLLPHVRNAGAFYAIIALAFGRECGLAAAYVALICYVSLCCATLGVFAFFVSDFAAVAGFHLPWIVPAMVTIVILGVLSFYRISLTAHILALALIAEVIAIVVLDIAILTAPGISLPPVAFTPSSVFGPGLGIAAIYAFNGCIGFEGTAIYQEEARDPARTIPRATYAAIAIVGLFYVFTAWCLCAASTPDVGAVARTDPGHFVFGIARRYLGAAGESILSILVMTSALAAVLGLFNNAARYVFALARDGVLPTAVAHVNPASGSPFRAGLPILAVLASVTIIFFAAGLDPLLTLATSLTGFGSVGLMALLALTAFAVPAFFLARRQASIATLVFPAAGGAMMLTGLVLSFLNYPALTGTTSALINDLPWLLLPLAMAGALQAMFMRKFRPEIYARIGDSRIGP